ncbi:MAG: ATP-binding protein [Parabacteroides gordonii]|nr:ATP-binding protein [Parabacteroides gordonii]
MEEQGRLSEALVLYDELNDMSLQRNKKTFIRQVNLLRALHELKNKEEQEHEMQVNKERMAEKQRQILFLSVVFIILLCLLYVLLLYYQRARRLKNELLKEKQASVFRRFGKLDDYKPGVGLGLSICTLIADRLNGTLAIDPTYENGARFIFTHPCGMPSSTCNRQTGEVN